jgi:O-antigen ligase/polysaccharide polymerase Wzy-like membrane protein/tetratricopeptide repeat protein
VLSPLAARRLTAFVIAAALPLYLAIEGGGYDLVIRQEAGLVTWWLLAGGLALGLLPRARADGRLAVPLLGALALVAVTALSLTWTESDERSFAELARLLFYVGLIALALAALHRHTWKAAAAGLSFAAFTVSGLAVASRLAPDAFPDALLGGTFPIDRLSYPFDYWNAVGAWGAISVAIGLAWSAHAERFWIRSLSLAAVPLAGLAVYLSYSRGGTIAAGAGILAVVVFSHNRWTASINTVFAAAGTALAILVVRDHTQIAEATGGEGAGAVALALLGAGVVCAIVAAGTKAAGMDRPRLPRSATIVAIPLLLVFAIGAAGTLGQDWISEQWDEFQGQDTTTAGDDPAARLGGVGGNRHDIWDEALDAFSSDPLKGTGAGTFEYWWSRKSHDPEFVRDAHSLYIEHLAELGVPGLVGLLAFLGGGFGVAVQARARAQSPSDAGGIAAMIAGFAAFAVSAGVDWMWEVAALGTLAIGGIAVAAAASSERRGRFRLGTGARFGLAAVALAISFVQLPGLRSGERVRESQQAVRDGDTAEARRLAGRAVDAEPWAATPYVQRALVAESEGRLDAARRDLERAAEKEPTNWRPRLLLARVKLKAGDDRGARAALRRAGRLYPAGPLFRQGADYLQLVREGG